MPIVALEDTTYEHVRRFAEAIQEAFPKIFEGREVDDNLAIEEAVGLALLWYSDKALMQTYRTEAEKGLDEKLKNSRNQNK
jgi:hypothetical protein